METELFKQGPRWFKDINDIFEEKGEVYTCFTKEELKEFVDTQLRQAVEEVLGKFVNPSAIPESAKIPGYTYWAIKNEDNEELLNRYTQKEAHKDE